MQTSAGAATTAAREGRVSPDRRVLAVPLAAIVLLVPLGVALVALAGHSWYPGLDLAMTEFRVRDVGGPHTPLIGLPGRFGNFPDQGSHLGPLSFYLLAPTYRLFGSTSWSLELGAAALQGASAVMALVIAYRRGGLRLTIAVAALVAFLMRGFGASVLSQPWNPYLPVMAWLVVLLAVWAVLCGDRPMLVAAAVAASLCLQTHISYLGLVGGLLALAVGGMAWAAWRSDPSTGVRRDSLRWGAITAGVVAVLWSPPVVDQLTVDPGNLGRLRDHFATSSEPPIGLVEGVRVMLRHLDLPRLLLQATEGSEYFVEAAYETGTSVLPGLVVVAVWIGSVAVAWRLRHQALLRLHLVVATALVLGVISMGRILGKLWYYLTLWGWTTAGVLVLAVGWTAVAWAAARREARGDRRGVETLHRRVSVVLVVLATVSTLVFAVEATRVTPPEVGLSDALGEVVGPTADALADGEGAATGRSGHYLVRWEDPFWIGSQGYGLVSELERRGFDVGVPETWLVPVTEQRVLSPSEVTAQVVLATGDRIDAVRADPQALEVAYHDPRDEEELEEFARLRAQAIDSLRGAGLDEAVPLVDDNLFAVATLDEVPERARQAVLEMSNLGIATAIFVLPAPPPP
ncbi:MAG: hypothetical protein ACR2JF_15640 [Iamia sp.]